MFRCRIISFSPRTLKSEHSYTTSILHVFRIHPARVRTRYLLLNISSFFRFSSSKIRDCFSYATLLDIEFDRSLL